jgi:peptidoglycan-associated lipoprotein
MPRAYLSSLCVAGLLTVLVACGAKKPAATGSGSSQSQFPGSAPAPSPTPTPATRPAPPPEPTPVVLQPETPVVSSDPFAGKDTDAINREGALGPVFFALDSDAIDDEAQKVLNANAELLKKYPTWAITIEGHSDERGTAEYNLALGERRALAAKTYLVSLGIAADRIRTVSYGKEFPFDPGHDEAAWKNNRRGHFVLTAK